MSGFTEKLSESYSKNRKSRWEVASEEICKVFSASQRVKSSCIANHLSWKKITYLAHAERNSHEQNRG